MPYRRSGCLTALLIVIGVALLLPGLCALLIVGIDPRSTLNEATGVVILLVCLAVSAGGIVLIWAAVRRPSR